MYLNHYMLNNVKHQLFHKYLLVVIYIYNNYIYNQKQCKKKQEKNCQDSSLMKISLIWQQ